jgi:hypothetical protein
MQDPNERRPRFDAHGSHLPAGLVRVRLDEALSVAGSAGHIVKINPEGEEIEGLGVTVYPVNANMAAAADTIVYCTYMADARRLEALFAQCTS